MTRLVSFFSPSVYTTVLLIFPSSVWGVSQLSLLSKQDNYLRTEGQHEPARDGAGAPAAPYLPHTRARLHDHLSPATAAASARRLEKDHISPLVARGSYEVFSSLVQEGPRGEVSAWSFLDEGEKNETANSSQKGPKPPSDGGYCGGGGEGAGPQTSPGALDELEARSVWRGTKFTGPSHDVHHGH